MNLDTEIDHVLAKLLANEGDPREVLMNFARAVRSEESVTVERLVPKCVRCEVPDSLCFRCKSLELVGEKGMAAMPVLIPRLGKMVMEWASDRKHRKAAERAAAEAQARAAQAHAQAQSRRPPPPPAGPQRF